MAAPLHIRRLNTSLCCTDPGEQNDCTARLRQVADGPLRQALEGVAERALSRAGMGPEAVVAVRRLELRLKLGEAVGDDDLVLGWSACLETALAQALLRAEGRSLHDSTTVEADPSSVVCFVDLWDAERHHLRRLAMGLGSAWWADRLRGAEGAPLDLTPACVLERWWRRHPGRAVATMAELAGETPGVAALLDKATAAALSEHLARQRSQRPDAGAELPEPGTPLRALLERSLHHLRLHPHLGVGAGRGGMGPSTSRLRPWRLAVLLRDQPALSRLSARALVRLADLPQTELWHRPAEAVILPLPGRPSPAPDASPPGSPLTDLAQRPDPVAAGPGQGRAWVHAGGLMMLLRRPDLLSGTGPHPLEPGDLAIVALRLLLDPLPVAQQAASMEQERPLLDVLAPDRRWPQRLLEAGPQRQATAEELLAQLIEAIPEGVTFAPGALRQVYGPRYAMTPPLPDGASHRLARFLWRPGLLVWDQWQISLSWPLATADGALRRAGWDLDPGWQPALRRVVRFHYRAETAPAEASP